MISTQQAKQAKNPAKSNPTLRSAPSRSQGGFPTEIIFGMLAGAAVGALIMFMLDPSAGRARRAMVRDKTYSYAKRTGQSLRRTALHAQQRAAGAVAEARAALRSQPVSDEKLHDRARAALGRCVTHPHSVKVQARDGVITLSGPVLADEVDELVACIGRVRGVCDVVNRLTVHDDPRHVPGLQG